MKILRSFGHAISGLRYSFTTQVNFRIHILFSILAIAGGVVLNISTPEWLLVVVCMAVVLCAELLNTAIEKLCDVVQPHMHPGIKLVKDIAAGAVLIAAAGSVVVACIIFLPKIFHLI